MDTSTAESIGYSFLQEFYSVLTNKNANDIQSFYASNATFSLNGKSTKSESISKSYSEQNLNNCLIDLSKGSILSVPVHHNSVVVTATGVVRKLNNDASALTEADYSHSFLLVPFKSSDSLKVVYYVLTDVLKLSEFKEEEVAKPAPIPDVKQVDQPTQTEKSKKPFANKKPFLNANRRERPTTTAAKVETASEVKKIEEQVKPVSAPVKKEAEQPKKEKKEPAQAPPKKDDKPAAVPVKKHEQPTKPLAPPKPSSWANMVSSAPKKEPQQQQQQQSEATTKPEAEEPKKVDEKATGEKSTTDQSKPPASRGSSSSNQVCVRKIPEGVSESDVSEMLSKFGKVKSVVFAPPRAKDAQLYPRLAFAEFEDRAAVQVALRANNADYLAKGHQLELRPRFSNTGSSARGSNARGGGFRGGFRGGSSNNNSNSK